MREVVVDVVNITDVMVPELLADQADLVVIGV